MALGYGSLIPLLLLLFAPALHAAEPSLDRAGDASRPPLLLSFVGDVMHHEDNAGMPDYDRLYDSVRHSLQVDDLTFANIEFPIDPSREPDGYPVFNGTVAYLEAAIRGGVDVLALANNHSFDLGPAGVAATQQVVADVRDRAAVHDNGLRPVPWQPIQPTRIVHQGWQIGFVSVTSIWNALGSAPYVNMVDYRDEPVRAGFLADVRRWSAEYDLLVVAVHAGREYRTASDPDTMLFLREIADAGAAIVWAHHPHVLQPWELRGDRLIVPSAGNFVSAQRRHQSPFVPVGRWAPTGDAAVYQVRVELDEDGARARLAAMPLYTMYDDPDHGLVLRTFEEVLTLDLPLAWRAFYLGRYAVMRRLVTTNEAPSPSPSTGR